MLDAAHDAARFLAQHTRADLDAEPFLWLGLVKCLEVIGEAASRITAERRQRYPEVDWRRVVGTRHRLVHDYDQINYDIVWDTANSSLPALVPTLERMLAEL